VPDIEKKELFQPKKERKKVSKHRIREEKNREKFSAGREKKYQCESVLKIFMASL